MDAGKRQVPFGFDDRLGNTVIVEDGGRGSFLGGHVIRVTPTARHR
jgi:hypothetical protein